MNDFKELLGDHESWADSRAEAARQQTRALVEMLKTQTNMAESAMALHKSIYMGEKRFQAERENIFLDQPLVACLSQDIPEPGTAVVFDAAGPSIIVSRDKEGNACAFLNMCTHRGAKIIEESEPWSGSSQRLSCPFHAWLFNSGGKLLGQPGKEGFEGCPIGKRDLIQVPCTEYLGMVLVRANPDGEPIDAKEFLGDFAQVLANLELWRAEPVKKGILTADSNWKYALDTYGESYHFSTLHKTTIAKTNYNDKNVFEPFGRHHKVTFPKLALAEILDLDESEWPQYDYGAVHFLFPNTVIFYGSVMPGMYFTQVFRLFPDGVGKTRCHFAVYAPFGIESDDHKESCEFAYDATAKVVQTEDYRVSSHGYANLKSAPENFEVLIGANEPALQAVHKHIADVISMPLAEIAD